MPLCGSPQLSMAVAVQAGLLHGSFMLPSSQLGCLASLSSLHLVCVGLPDQLMVPAHARWMSHATCCWHNGTSTSLSCRAPLLSFQVPLSCVEACRSPVESSTVSRPQMFRHIGAAWGFIPVADISLSA